MGTATKVVEVGAAAKVVRCVVIARLIGRLPTAAEVVSVLAEVVAEEEEEAAAAAVAVAAAAGAASACMSAT